MTAYLARNRTGAAGWQAGRESAPVVLVAEDHEDTRVLLRTILERRGFSVVEVCDGEEAVAVAERLRPDLILMDGSLPRLDGISATRRMRRLSSLSGIPIVFVSGHAGPQQQTEAREAGCDDYLVKPFKIALLYNSLERLLPNAGAVAEGADRQHS